MAKEVFPDGEFNPNTSVEQIHNLAERLRQRSFYAPVLIDTFFEHVDEESLVANVDSRYRFYAIGGRIKDHAPGYTRLWWSMSADVDKLKMAISLLRPKSREKERESLIYSEGHMNRLTIESAGERFGAFASFKGNNKWDQEVVSDLRMSFDPSKWLLAPTNPSDNFDYWLLTQFIPDFLKNNVAQIANVPVEKMTGSITTGDPEGDI